MLWSLSFETTLLRFKKIYRRKAEKHSIHFDAARRMREKKSTQHVYILRMRDITMRV